MPYKAGGEVIIRGIATDLRSIFTQDVNNILLNNIPMMEGVNKVSDFDLKKPPKLLNGLENSPTRLMLRVNDFGVAQKGSKKKDVQLESELAVYQNKSYIRNNLLFSQSFKISTSRKPTC